MKKSDFAFELPQQLIAQTPLENRTFSKLMVLNRRHKTIKSEHFYNVVDLFKAGDVLVLNDTKVIPARLFGIKDVTNAKVEILLLKEIKTDVWEALVGNAKVVKVDTVVKINAKLSLKCLAVKDEGIRVFKLNYTGNIYEILEEIGNMPLPPYIKETLTDKERYQTVYAKNLGSAAAPTAGLHFDKELLKTLGDKGVIIKYVTLHVGLGTFLPMKVDNVLEHQMHAENYQIDDETAAVLNSAKANQQRIIAVGTTTLRTLEANYKKNGEFKAESASTDIFIYPGIEIKSIDSLITNFHLPESTLLMLVSAFASKELIMEAYQKAINEKYRFFSFGDVMWIQ